MFIYVCDKIGDVIFNGLWTVRMHNAEFIAHICTCIIDLAGAVDLSPSRKFQGIY